MNPVVIGMEHIKEGWGWPDIALWNKTQYLISNLSKDREVAYPNGSYNKRGKANRKLRTSLKRLYKEFQID